MSVKIKNRHRLKSKDIKKIQQELQQIFSNITLDEKSCIETGDVEGTKMIFIDSEPCFIYYEDKIIFTLLGINKFHPKEHFVVIDMGAIRFVTNGADVMAPGIVDADINISKGDQVWICDERHHKPLATGFAIMDGMQMKTEKKGKAIQIVHYVGDDLWNFVAKSL